MALLVGCGDVLVAGDYPGEPLLVVTGQVLVAESLQAAGSPSVALLWTEAGTDNRAETAVEVTTRFPSYYELRVYQPPTESDFFEDPVGDRLALGVILLFDDIDGDGHFRVGTDAAIGTAEATHVAWFTAPPHGQPDAPTEAYLVGHGLPSCRGGPPDGDTAEDSAGEPPGGLPVQAGVGEADLVVADVCTLLPDWNCDGELEEWRDLCG